MNNRTPRRGVATTFMSGLRDGRRIRLRQGYGAAAFASLRRARQRRGYSTCGFMRWLLVTSGQVASDKPSREASADAKAMAR
jgi:hypothetical protein